MKNLRKLLPVFFSIFIVCSFFYKVFLERKVPIPGDFIVGVYYPWLDYKWGTITGVIVKNPIMADVVSFSYPMRILAINLWKSGTIPFWNPYILTGTPLLANFQSAPFSVTNVFYIVFGNLAGWSLQIITQHILALIFTYILLRYWKVSKTGSFLGGLIYAFSGFNLIWSQWNAHTLVAAFLPMIIYCAERLLKKEFVFGIFLSLFLTCQILSGYPQLVFYTFFIMGILWLFRIIHSDKKILITFLFAIFIILGVLGASAQILPGAELLSQSQRAVELHPFDWAFLPWQKVITFIAPDFFGNHVTRNYWGPQDYTSNTGFVGVVSIFLAIFALFSIRKKKEIGILTFLTVFSLMLSFPTFLSVFLWKSGVFGLNAAAAHRALVIFCLSIALLAGFGFDCLNSFGLKKKFGVFLLIFIVLAGFGIFSLHIHQMVGVKNLILPSAVLFATFLVAGFIPRNKKLLILLAIGELFYFGWKFTPFAPVSYVYPDTPVITFLKSQEKPFRTTGDNVIPINFRMAYGIESVEGYDAVYPASASKLIQVINGGGEFRRYAIVDNETSPVLDLVNTKYYLATKTDENKFISSPKRFTKVFSDKSVDIFESKTVMPRAFMTYNWQVDKSRDFEKLTSPNVVSGKLVFLDEDPGFRAENGVQKVIYTTYKNEESVIDVTTTKDGMLFVSDAYYPGWKAYIDGQETKIYRADFAFRAIHVPKGEHTVRMVYKPDSFYLGLKITIASFVILIIIGIVFVLCKRKY